MFYKTTDRDHGLPHDPLKAIVAPRPIGWISTISKSGLENLAPYSFFNAVSSRPDIVMFSSVGWKDSANNARDTGEFVCNYVSADLGEQMNITSTDAPVDVSEFDHASLERAECILVAPSRVAKAYAALECKVTEIMQPKDLDGNSTQNVIVFGEVVGVHIDESVITDGRFDVSKARPITRLGYMDYDGPDGIFEMNRPPWDG